MCVADERKLLNPIGFDGVLGSVRPGCEHVFVLGHEVHQAALALIAAGVSDTEIARRLGVARTTIRDWRRPRYERTARVERCSRCWRTTRPVRFTAADYAELLGLYLGDGYIGALPRTERLRIFL